MYNIAIQRMTIRGAGSLKSKTDFEGKSSQKKNGVLVA